MEIAQPAGEAAHQGRPGRSLFRELERLGSEEPHEPGEPVSEAARELAEEARERAEPAREAKPARESRRSRRVDPPRRRLPMVEIHEITHGRWSAGP